MMKNYFNPTDNSYGAVPEDASIPEGCVEVEAQPAGDFEKHDENGKIVVDAAAKADFEAGAEHIREVHIVKAIEARLIKAGYVFEGLVHAEAEALNVSVADLTDRVLAQSQAQITTEIARRTLKENVNADA